MSALAQPILARIALVGDSNLVLPARAIVEQCQCNAAGPYSLAPDFVGAVSGTGLRDEAELVNRLYDVNVRMGGHDAYIVNVGQNDLFFEDAVWQAWFAGTTPSPGGHPFYARIQAVLDAIDPDVPVYWLGVASGLPSWAHPWEVAAVNLSALAYENPSGVAAAGFSSLLAPSGQPDPRFRYVDTDALLGSVTPRYELDGVHLTYAAASALWAGLVARIKGDLDDG